MMLRRMRARFTVETDSKVTENGDFKVTENSDFEVTNLNTEQRSHGGTRSGHV